MSTYFTRVSSGYETYSSWTESAELIAAELELLRRSTAGDGVTCLDVGCGTANHLLRMADLQADLVVIGLDASMPMLRNGQASGATTLTLGVAEQLPFGDHSFGMVIGRQVLHYVDLAATVAEIDRVLIPGGVFLSSQQVDYGDVPREWYQEWSDMRGHPARRRLDENDLRDALSRSAFVETSSSRVSIQLSYVWEHLAAKYGVPEGKVKRFFESTDEWIRARFSMSWNEIGIEYVSSFKVARFEKR